jgi:hypothetical protein
VKVPCNKNVYLLHGVLRDDVLEVMGLAEGLDGLEGLLDGEGGDVGVDHLNGLKAQKLNDVKCVFESDQKWQ